MRAHARDGVDTTTTTRLRRGGLGGGDLPVKVVATADQIATSVE